MKRILPFLSLIGASVMITGCSNNLTNINLNNNTKDNLKTFSSSVNSMPNIENAVQTSVKNKYQLSIDTPKTLELLEDNIVEENNVKESTNSDQLNLSEEIEPKETIEDSEENNAQESDDTENLANEQQNNDEQITQEDTNISTLYSISNDVEQSCEEFCELKEEITEAIAETERLIEKIDSNELNLTREQRIYLNEQAMQLKNLGKQLSNSTTHLAFNLSDLKQVLNENNADINQLSLKYLIVLDNLVNSNEMLQTGLTSLNLMNNLLYNNNSQSRMIFGYQNNNNPPVIKDYTINENGEITENEINKENVENTENSTSTLDTYNQTNLNTNIDSYYSNNPKNIDSFFNTALLDNQFMYGNGGLYGGYAYGMNPYLNQYAQYEKNQNYNSANGVNNTNNTQNIENIPSDNVDEDGEKIGNKERKKLNIKKNIDTYRDENTPDLKTRFNNFKQTISNAFGKIDPKNDIKHPVYKY